MSKLDSQNIDEIKSGNRFSFGENWSRFLISLDEKKIHQAEQSLCTMLKKNTLQGKRFLDIGSGSGLFSLAARRLGAQVHSFDFDPQSVSCTNILKNKYFPDDPDWMIEEGSILDSNYISRLGEFDIVYSWGVLHHTGKMLNAFSNIIPSVAIHGLIFIAIYNDQGVISRYWTFIKSSYNKSVFIKYLWISIHTPYLFAMRWITRALTGRLSIERGMSLWRDMIDWLGGYPFEVAKPELVFNYFHENGFNLEKLKTCGGRMGCNEFVFRRIS